MQRALIWLNLVVRLADISSKTVQKCVLDVFWPFLSLCWTASRPYRLSHINALRIIQFYQPENQCSKFSQKNIENWRFWKTSIFWVGHFEFFFSKKKLFLVFSNEKNHGFNLRYNFFRNCDDYPGFPPKTTPVQRYATHVYFLD